MNLPPAEFWVKAGAGIVVGIFALVLERADAAMAAKYAKNQGSDDGSPWYTRTVVYAVAGVWLAVIFTTTADLIKWRSSDVHASVLANNEERNREESGNIAEGVKPISYPSNNIYASRQVLNGSPAALDQGASSVVQIEGTASNTQNEYTDSSRLVLPSTSSLVQVVKDESDFALAAAELANSRRNPQQEAVDEPSRNLHRVTTLAHPFRPKSASLTINVDPNGPFLKEWYSETTQAIQAALSKGKAETGNGSIVLSESGVLELSRDSSKHSEATVEYRNGKLVSARFDDHSVLLQPGKGHRHSWAARGSGLRFGFRSRDGGEAWFETGAYPSSDPKKGDTNFVANLYPEDKRIQLKINCRLAVNSAYSDVSIDELDGGTLTIATPLVFWQKRPISIDLGNDIAMSSESALPESKLEGNGVLVAIDHADRGVKVQKDELGWYQAILPLKKEDLKAMRP